MIDYDTKTRLMTLRADKLDYQQKARLRAVCEQRLGDFLEQRGMGRWDYRMIDASTVPHSLRYQLLAESNRRCALCGASEKERPLDVDHIIPGRAVATATRRTCRSCARAVTAPREIAARATSARRWWTSDPLCPFCADVIEDRVIETHDTVIAVRHEHPVTRLHTLIVPRRHTADFLTMTEDERREANDLIRVMSGEITRGDPSVDGFNVGANCGDAAGQTVLHAHIHLIPRSRGDTPEPDGGVRGVVPARMRY